MTNRDSEQSTLYNRAIDLEDANASLAMLYSYVSDNSLVLDVGCASGQLGIMLNHQKHCRVYGLEYNHQSVQICLQSGAFTNVLQVDLNNFDIAKLNLPQFDYIIFADVLEHLIEPLDVLNKLQSFLKPTGHFLFSIPNIAHASIKTNLLFNDWTYTPLGILDATHLRFFTYQTIADFLSQAKLGIVSRKYTTLELDGYQPHKLSELPLPIQDFIRQDVHSQICQYIISCQKSDLSLGKLKSDNLQALRTINVLPTKNNLKSKLKRFLMVNFPGLIKYIQIFRR